MAYSIYRSGAPASYLQSFRFVEPAADIKDIASDLGVRATQQSLMKKWQIESELARTAFQEKAANIRQEKLLEYNREVNEKNEDLARRRLKMEAMASMLGGQGSGSLGEIPLVNQGGMDTRSEMERQMVFTKNFRGSERDRLGDLDPIKALRESQLKPPSMYRSSNNTPDLSSTFATTKPSKLDGAKSTSQADLVKQLKDYLTTQ